MPWARFDDQLHGHPKVIALGEQRLAGMGLQLLACCWSSAYLTDGFIPANVAQQLSGGDEGRMREVVAALLDAGLWHRDEHSDGYRIHDFLDYNPSKREVVTHRDKMRRLGRVAGLASADKRRKDKAERLNGKSTVPVISLPTPVPSRPVPSRTPTTTPESTSSDAAASAPSGPVWDAYSDAYGRRYGQPPVRNAKVNSLLAALVKRLGADEAPAVAAFYVTHHAAFYARAGHAVDLLLRDAEKLRTEWATGQRITEAGARAGDQRQERGSIAGRLLEKAERQAKGELPC